MRSPATVGENGPKISRHRRCLCVVCRDDCITATNSEFCSECEIRHVTGGAVCH